MKTHEQLATLITALEQGGWQRLNGNQWQRGVWLLTTGYTYQEATLQLQHMTRKHTPRGDSTYYRGADPLTWVLSKSVRTATKSLRNLLDISAE